MKNIKENNAKIDSKEGFCGTAMYTPFVWHDINQTLPKISNFEETHWVLASDSRGAMFTAKFMQFDNEEPALWYQFGRDGYSADDVCFWMELPEAPTKVKKHGDVGFVTDINHEQRTHFGLLINDYCFLDLIHNFQVKNNDWCNKQPEEIGDILGLSRATAFNIVKKLIGMELLIKNDSRKQYQVSKEWINYGKN